VTNDVERQRGLTLAAQKEKEPGTPTPDHGICGGQCWKELMAA